MDLNLAKKFVNAVTKAKSPYTKQGFLKRPYMDMKFHLGETLKVGDIIEHCMDEVAKIKKVVEVRMFDKTTGRVCDWTVTVEHDGRDADFSWMYCCSPVIKKVRR